MAEADTLRRVSDQQLILRPSRPNSTMPSVVHPVAFSAQPGECLAKKAKSRTSHGSYFVSETTGSS
jgi:hypothetical protein